MSKPADQVFETETLTFVVKGADTSLFDNFDYDEMIAIVFALRERANAKQDAVPNYASYLRAIADKIEAVAD